jgi:phenylalanyl-tRNA synthetase alpha chain
MQGHIHPITSLIDQTASIFTKIGFDVVDGPELESEWYNFDALNVPKDHPSRDMQDTFLIRSDSVSGRTLTPKEERVMEQDGALPYVLRTHTSNTQIRTIEKWIKEKGAETNEPLAVISCGKVFRNEATDARHEAQFFQVEGLMVGHDVTLANLRGTLEHYFSSLFSKQLSIRFRSSFFPFVEPGLEVDMQCFKCEGTGIFSLAKCNVCSATGWIEIMGAGMVHPNVLQNAGLNPREYQGFAFGGGIDRLAMLKWGLDDIRLLYNGDLRLVNQF